MNTTMQHNSHDHSNHNEEPMMDHSMHEGMDHSAHNANNTDHSMHKGMDHSGHDEMDHSAHAGHNMPETKMDHSSHAGHSMPADMDHSSHAGHGTDHSGHEQMFRIRFWWSLLLSIPVLVYSEMIQMWLGFTPPMFPFAEWIPFVLSVVIFAYGGIPFLQMATPELKDRKPGMMTLISLAISVAFIYSVAAQFINLGEGFFWELVTLIDVMLLGHWLEMRSVRQASGALNELARLMPDTAERIIKGSATETVSVSDLKNGDLILIRPGTSIPADGEVVGGYSDVNESMITGESKPVHKHKPSKVIAGTLNGDGSLRVKVTATGDETALAGIMRLVEQAQQSKSKTQVLADKAAGWLFYIALASAILTAIAWTIADTFNIDVLNRVVTVLVIACPHALGLAIPLVVAITTAVGAKNGILVRDRLALESARQIDIVIFDKTGTLTQGQFGVVDMMTADGWENDRALSLAAALESDSEHLIAGAIRRLARDRKLVIPPVNNFSALKGRGVQADFENETYYIGGPRLLEQLKLNLQTIIADFTNSASAKSQSVVYLTTQKSIIAAIAIADVVRTESKQAVDELKRMGIEVAMLTGDSRPVAEAVAKELGINRVFAEVLPEHKDQKVAELQSLGKRVAMVGDGVNDAPALTRADVGIAIGGGTDVAIESAGLILVNSNPLDVVKIFKLSRASYSKMIQNLWWAAGYNIITIPLAAGVLASWGILLSPAFGAVLMSISTIVVAINAQLLRKSSI